MKIHGDSQSIGLPEFCVPLGSTQRRSGRTEVTHPKRKEGKGVEHLLQALEQEGFTLVEELNHIGYDILEDLIPQPSLRECSDQELWAIE